MSGPVAGFLLEGDDAALNAALVRIAVAHLERRYGTAPAGALRLRDQLARFAARVHVNGQASEGRETAEPPAAGDAAQWAPRIRVPAAARRLGVSEQAVRRWCRSGDLIASRTPAGPWLIEGSSAVALAASRERGT